MRTAREKLLDNGIDNEEMLLIDDDAFCESLIGTTDDERAVYDYNMMVDEFSKYHGCSTEDAADYINFNVLRALPYYGNQAPIVVFTMLE